MATARAAVYFECQRCFQPLKLDDSFNSLGEHILAELTLPLHTHPDVDIESQATSFDNYVNPCRLSDSGNGMNGFMLISDQTEGISNKLKIHATLFDTLSGNSNIDHPLCDECTDSLLELLEQEIKFTEIDYYDYCKYLQKLEKEQFEPRLQDLQKELQEHKCEEQQLLRQLNELRQEEVATLEAIKVQEGRASLLAQDEEHCWRLYMKHRKDALYMEDENRSLKRQLSYTRSQLERLKKTNVFNATFHIWHDGHFGTINNFKLGRLPSNPVDWSEINAAWGQTALLLSALARKLNLSFEKYKLVPNGNHSFIEVIGEQKELPLFVTGGIRYVWDTKFDSGMVAFLDCLQQFKEKVEKGEGSFRLPYVMNKGKIEDSSSNTHYSIKIKLNSEEQWTKALKFMLTNLKWSLTWVSAQFNRDLQVSTAD